MGGLVAYRLMTALNSAKVCLVSSMTDYYVPKSLRVKSARTANEAYLYSSELIGKNGKVSFVPYGNLTMPAVKT